LATALAACSDDARAPIATAVVGPQGGRLEAPGMSLDIPAGALGESAEISVFVEARSLPGREILSPVLRFEPDGLTFDQPATVSVDIPDGKAGIVFFGNAGDLRPIGIAANGKGGGPVDHFSEVVVDDCNGVGMCRCAPEVGTDACNVQSKPSPSATCGDDEHLFDGRNGDVRQGWVEVFPSRYFCYCRANVTYTYNNARDGVFMCKRPWKLVDGIWQCHVDETGESPKTPQDNRGIRGFPAPADYEPVGFGETEVSIPCSGYWIDYATLQSQGANRDGTGQLIDCQEEIYKDWKQLACTLYNCASLEDTMSAGGFAEEPTEPFGQSPLATTFSDCGEAP